MQGVPVLCLLEIWGSWVGTGKDSLHPVSGREDISPLCLVPGSQPLSPEPQSSRSSVQNFCCPTL